MVARVGVGVGICEENNWSGDGGDGEDNSNYNEGDFEGGIKFGHGLVSFVVVND